MSVVVFAQTLTLALELYIYVICLVCFVIHGCIAKDIILVYVVITPKHTNITTAILISPLSFKLNSIYTTYLCKLIEYGDRATPRRIKPQCIITFIERRFVCIPFCSPSEKYASRTN